MMRPRGDTAAQSGVTAIAALPCSIVLGTLSLDAGVKDRIAALCEQAARVGGEVVVGCGAGPAPSALAGHPNLVWLERRASGLFDVRRLAVQRARGDVVVISEDHCTVEPGWIAGVLASHGRHPDADVIVGRVENGTTSTAVDRAAFFVSLSRLVVPIDPRAARAQVPIAGASLKRRAIERLVASSPGVPLELVPTATLDAQRLRFVVDDTLCISHLQEGGWLFHGALNFHNARAVSGSSWRRSRPRTWARLGMTPPLLLVRTLRTLRRVRGTGASLGLTLVLGPAVVWLYTFKAAGEWMGAVFGPGQSPFHLR